MIVWVLILEFVVLVFDELMNGIDVKYVSEFYNILD